MPDADFQGFQAELALLREQVESQLAAHRLEVTAAIERLAQRGAALSGEDFRARLLEWERREAELGERISARTLELQALRAQTEIEQHRRQMQIGDLEKQLVLRGTENAKLKSLLEALMAEHAGCGRNSAAERRRTPKILQWKARCESSEEECAKLRHAMESSVALRLARAMPRLLGPLPLAVWGEAVTPGRGLVVLLSPSVRQAVDAARRTDDRLLSSVPVTEGPRVYIVDPSREELAAPLSGIGQGRSGAER